MPGSTNYKGNPAIFNRHVNLERDRGAARQRAEERLAQAIRDASPIVTPPVRRKREEGGPIRPGSKVTVGERGPETFTPAMPGTIETPKNEES